MFYSFPEVVLEDKSIPNTLYDTQGQLPVSRTGRVACPLRVQLCPLDRRTAEV